MARCDRFPLPKGWPRTIKSSVLHAVSLASAAMTTAWARAARNRRPRVQPLAELERANSEIALLKEELRIKDTRWSRVPPRRRPYYSPIQRMRILRLKAARSWSSAQTAEIFLITEETIASWLRRIDEEGEHALVQTPEPVNRLPAFVGYLVRWLKSMCPQMGKVRIAQVLARAGLQLGATTVGRMLRETGPIDEPGELVGTEEALPASLRAVKANYPDHVWHVDLTVIPTAPGFWVPWMPFSKLQRWPFSWWVAVAIDQFSRRVKGFALFTTMPASSDICEFFDRLTERTGSKPRHVITDKGRQFFSEEFKSWCRERGIGLRFGAVGQQGSVAVIERFFRSMKDECTRQISVPLGVLAMRRELASYVIWHNEHRPHQALDGKTPAEVHVGVVTVAKSFEPRGRWPLSDDGECERVGRLSLELKFIDGKRHLPIVELKRAA